MPQRRRLHHGWTWVTPPLRRQASISASVYHVCLFNFKFSKVCVVCAIPAWAGIALACGGEQGSFQRWLEATVSTAGVWKVRHREYARSGNWTRPCSFMPLSSAVALRLALR